MTETKLASLCDGQIADAVSYEETELAKIRDTALKYRDGVMDDLPAETGKSSVVSRDVQDTIGWIKPGLMRVFLSGEKVADYQPRRPDQEQHSKDATEFVNFVFLEECDGYKVLADGLDDGLGIGNGVLKHWWDATPTYTTETFTGLSDDAFTQLVSDDDVEVLEHTAYTDEEAAEEAGGEEVGEPNGAAEPGEPDEAPNAGAIPQADGNPPAPMPVPGTPGGGQAGPGGLVPAGPGAPALPAPQVSQTLHDVKIKRKCDDGRLRVRALPPENFLIPRNAICLDETIDGCGDWDTPTRSDLIKRGFDKAIVDLLPAYNISGHERTKMARDPNNTWDLTAGQPEHSMERVKIYEWYPLVDYNGDGVAERLQVVIGDRGGENEERRILSVEEWGDDLPYTDLVPDPVPHRWRGRSIYDETADVQKVKTVLMRQTLDNLYLVNNPQWEVVHSQIDNKDALVNRELGANILVKQAGSVNPLVTPFVAQQSFPVLEYMDAVVEKRTGVSRSSMALDPETLQNQTATAINAQQSAAMSKVELYARNIAETGLKRLFKCLLRLVIQHQDRPKMIRLRGKPVSMDPRVWDADMDVSINVGLGAGSRDRDMMILQQIAMKQEQILLQMGPQNPLVTMAQYRYTLAKMIEVGGVRSPEQFFQEVDDQKLAAWMQSKSQQPDPKMAEIQMKANLEQQKLQMTSQLQMQQFQAKSQIEGVQAQADIATQQAKMQSEAALAQQRFELERQIKMMEAELAAQAHHAELTRKQQQHEADIALKVHMAKQKAAQQNSQSGQSEGA